MIITDRFVFAHIPKAGGVFLQRCIRAHFTVLAEWEGDASHQSIEFLPPEHRGKPVLAVLRNPWAWYLSWFAFCAAKGSNPQFLRNYEPGAAAFRRTIENLLAPNHGDPVIDEFMAREDIGLLEMHRFHILDLECPDHDISYARLECLAEDVVGFLENRSIPVPPGLAQALTGPPANTSRHGPVAEAYPEDLRQLVARKERRIIRIGDYRFPEASSSARPPGR